MTWGWLAFWGAVVVGLYAFWLWDEARQPADETVWIVSPSGVEIPLTGAIVAADVFATLAEIDRLPEVQRERV